MSTIELALSIFFCLFLFSQLVHFGLSQHEYSPPQELPFPTYVYPL